MATTRTRRTIRVGLLLLLAGIVTYGGYRAWARSRPEMIWARAQEFLQGGDTVAAKAMLERLLAKDPAHAQGHLALAQLLLQAARQAQPTATYAKTAEADRHLKEAVRLAKSGPDTALPVMQECVAHGLWAQAAEMAELVLKLDPQNADALYALAANLAASRRARPGVAVPGATGPVAFRAARQDAGPAGGRGPGGKASGRAAGGRRAQLAAGRAGSRDAGCAGACGAGPLAGAERPGGGQRGGGGRADQGGAGLAARRAWPPGTSRPCPRR